MILTNIKKLDWVVSTLIVLLLIPIKSTAESSYVLPSNIPPAIFVEYLAESSLHCSGWNYANAMAVGNSEDRTEVKRFFLDKAENFNTIFTKTNATIQGYGAGYSPSMIMDETQKLFKQYENLIFSDTEQKALFLESIENSCNLVLRLGAGKLTETK